MNRRFFSLALVAFTLWLTPAFGADCIYPSNEVVNGVILRAKPSTTSARRGLLRPTERLPLVNTVAGWYETRAASGRSVFVSKRWTDISDCGVTPEVASTTDLPRAVRGAGQIKVVSFNIQFLGNFKNRRNDDLVEMLRRFDLVIVQELVAPPFVGTFPDGSPFVPDPEAAEFFKAMQAKGFDFVLSEEDTGTGSVNHLNSAATEWFVAFYKPARVKPASALPQGFLAEDRSDNPDYERVPYAHAFRAGKADLVFISVHLMPGSGRSARARRAHELKSIAAWISSRTGIERDYVILGDMNIEDCNELTAVLPEDYASMNHECQATNTNVRSPKPYDHVMYRIDSTKLEINTAQGMTVINLIEEMRQRWPANHGPFPGDPYSHDAFRTLYSDHHPVLFAIRTGGPDDD